jgi:hypothetical protein
MHARVRSLTFSTYISNVCRTTMSTLKTNPFAPSEGTCYNRSTRKECTTQKNGKYSAKDWKNNVTYGKNDGQKMTEPERVLIKSYLSHLELDGTETDGELIHLANENEIEINNLRGRFKAKDMLKRVEQAYKRSSKRFVEDHKYDYLPNCTIKELLDNLNLLSKDPSASDFDTWIGYAKFFVNHAKRINNELTKPLRFDNQGGWRPREGELDGGDGGGCTIT